MEEINNYVYKLKVKIGGYGVDTYISSDTYLSDVQIYIQSFFHTPIKVTEKDVTVMKADK